MILDMPPHCNIHQNAINTENNISCKFIIVTPRQCFRRPYIFEGTIVMITVFILIVSMMIASQIIMNPNTSTIEIATMSDYANT